MNRLLLSSKPSDQTALHKLVVQVALVGSLSAVALLGTFGLATGDRSMVIETWAPMLAAVIFGIQLIGGKPNALVAMAAGIGVVVFTYPAVGDEQTFLAAALGVVAMSTVASLFVVHHRSTFLLVGSALIVTVPIFWLRSFSGGIGSGLVMTFSFLIGASAFMLIRRHATDSDQRFRWLFESAPVALFEQDWKEALTIIETLDPANADDLRSTLETRPEIVDSIIGAVEVVGTNRLADEMLKETSYPLLVGDPRPVEVVGHDQQIAISRIVDMWAGRPPDDFQCEPPSIPDQPQRWFEVRTIRVGTSGSHRVILAVSDVSESRRESAVLAELVREKDAFVATVSHELRTPLTAVVGLANEVLHAHDLTESEARELLEMVVSQANEISYLVEDLLVGARTHIGTITVATEEVDVGAEVETVLATLSTEVAVSPTYSPVMALADPIRVRQIVRNLVVNAERYGGGRRRIVVRTSPETTLLEMRDDGPPIGMNDRQMIFEPYTRAHDRPGVTMSVGLGLAVSRQLARLMGGELEYDHDGLEGIFRLTLPLVDAEPGSSDGVGDSAIPVGAH